MSRAAVLDLLAFVLAASILSFGGAPFWAFGLLLYMGTFPSRGDVFVSISTLQSTIRKHVGEDKAEVEP